MNNLPETADEFLVGDVAITIDIVVSHEGLELDLLWEDSTKWVQQIQIKLLLKY